MEYLDHALEQDLHTTLHKAKVWSRKKGKHKKDTIVKLNKGDDPWASQRDNYGKMKFTGVGFRYVHRGQFKHIRAKSQFLEEEYTPYSEEYKVNSSYMYDAEMDGLDQYEEDLLFEGYEQYLGTRGDVLFDKIQEDKVNPKCIWCGESNYCECY